MSRTKPATQESGPLLDALRDGDYAAAEGLLASNPQAPAQLLKLAEGLMRRRRWSEAAWLLGRLEPREPAAEMKRCLSRNLAAMQRHRPAIYDQLIHLPTTDAFGIAPAAGGRPTVLARRDDGTAVSLSGGGDPLAAAGAMHEQIKRATPNGEAVALCGLGDGYVLQRLAQNRRELFMDMEQAVFVLEPRPQVLLHVLMIHDCAADNGPIAAERFRWFVGAEWSAQLDRAVAEQPTIGLPAVTVQQGFDGPAAQARVQAGIKALVERDQLVRRQIEAYYATLAPRAVADLMMAHPPRTPRVLLITTRFSTVLQYSTRDTAEAFRELGWDARVLIEPGPSHRLYQHTIRRAVADFKPDLVFQIDHLRHEHKDLFPANLPFVCWGQDHLPNLITPDAGRRVGSLDFVLTDNPVGYASNYAYPPRQLISTPKLTRVSSEPLPAPTTKVEDIVFVSNASRTPEQLLDDVLREWDDSQGSLSVLIEAARRVLQVYAGGGTISTYGEIRAIARDCREHGGVAMLPGQVLRVCKWLTHPFNDALYRQQALRWATSLASAAGLSVGLYGKGWDANPDFAAFARGPVAYGEPLRGLTRAAGINLQIVPYLCLHQRLLDGLCAGGFFLVRQNPNDVYPQALLNFVDRHAGPDVRTTDAARAAIDPQLLPEFESLLARAAQGTVSSDGEDAVTLVRDWADAGNLQPGGEVLPRLSEVSFDDERSLGELLAKFKDAPESRGEIAAEQRDAVAARLSYVAGIGRVQQRIAALLRETGGRGVRRCA